MKISFGTRLSGKNNISGINGYGYATLGMLTSLESLGYQVEENDASADVEIWFDQPHHWKFSKDVYKIGYHPWESTLLVKGWAEIMNECDEIWTPSPLIAQWYKQYSGIAVPVYVYEHGIDHIWKPVLRDPGESIKFLHIGGETRKGAWDSVYAFNRAFTGRENATLTIKTVDCDWNKIPQIGRTKFINKKFSFDELQELYYTHDVYSYPSFGEGFGLTPLQALATGMPTVTLPAWAPYREFLDPRLSVKSELKPSRWEIHPGKMFRPDFDDFTDKLHFAAENYDDVMRFAASNANEIHQRYDWNTITAKVFSDLETRLKNS